MKKLYQMLLLTAVISGNMLMGMRGAPRIKVTESPDPLSINSAQKVNPPPKTIAEQASTEGKSTQSNNAQNHEPINTNQQASNAGKINFSIPNLGIKNTYNSFKDNLAEQMGEGGNPEIQQPQTFQERISRVARQAYHAPGALVETAGGKGDFITGDTGSLKSGAQALGKALYSAPKNLYNTPGYLVGKMGGEHDFMTNKTFIKKQAAQEPAASLYRSDNTEYKPDNTKANNGEIEMKNLNKIDIINDNLSVADLNTMLENPEKITVSPSSINLPEREGEASPTPKQPKKLSAKEFDNAFAGLENSSIPSTLEPSTFDIMNNSTTKITSNDTSATSEVANIYQQKESFSETNPMSITNSTTTTKTNSTDSFGSNDELTPNQPSKSSSFFSFQRKPRSSTSINDETSSVSSGSTTNDSASTDTGSTPSQKSWAQSIYDAPGYLVGKMGGNKNFMSDRTFRKPNTIGTDVYNAHVDNQEVQLVQV